MGQVFVSASTGTAVYVFADDHCPPHVHARHRGDGWVARVRFSYVASAVELISIAPLKNPPLRRVLNQLLGDIHTRLSDCRRSWWATRRTTCLENRWAVTPASGTILLCPGTTPGAKQIADGGYDPAAERLKVTFRDGTIAEVSTQP
jgi:hypothetical protein